MRKTGFGGALKNIGMGCGSRAGKMAMHADGKPYVKTDLCVGCGACAKICAHNGPQIADKKCHIDQNNCVGCGRCIGGLSQGRHPSDFPRPVSRLLNCKIAEYAKAVLDRAVPATASTLSDRRFAELRLPPGKRRPHCPGRRHVRICRPRRAGSGLR